MKTLICLSLAFVLAASVAVISKTSLSTTPHAESSANYLY
jgi:hypothetical protein